jgi:diaminopimelate decarboxylase
MWLSTSEAHDLASRYGTPVYVYAKERLRERAATLSGLSLPFGCTVRYAVKANPHPEIINLFAEEGLHFDVSSSYEAALLVEQGIAGDKISLSSQQPAHNLPELLKAGVRYVATSVHQLEEFAAVAAAGSRVALRVNTGIGSGHNNRTKTAGVTASFGLWHEYLDQALALVKARGFVVDRLHTHIGSGADPAVWGEAMDTALEIAIRMPEVVTLNIGGGYKVHRFGEEKETDMTKVAAVFHEKLEQFAQKTKRALRLEIEPGTWLVAHAGCLVTKIVDIVDTGKEGFVFLRTNTGMNDILRPTLYGAQHGMRVLSETMEKAEYVVVGHNCETGDILTPELGNPEGLAPRLLSKARIGDLLIIEDTGAYCASMRAKGYNAFPDAREVLI